MFGFEKNTAAACLWQVVTIKRPPAGGYCVDLYAWHPKISSGASLVCRMVQGRLVTRKPKLPDAFLPSHKT